MLSRRSIQICVGSFLVLVATAPVQAQRGFLALQMNLGTLVDASGTIVTGRVISVHPEPHPDYGALDTVVVTVEVTDTLKGETVTEYTYRQFLPDIRDKGTAIGYKPGQEVLLIMTATSDAGFSSPVGIAQGRFLITSDAQGNRVAVNGLGNMGLFLKIEKTHPELSQRLSPQAQQIVAANAGGSIAADRLIEIIRAAVNAREQK